MPRQDYEMIFQFGGITAQDSLTTLGTMQPTSKFGELFQYSNPMAAAAGYVAGHILYPEMELGAAYDRAIQSQVFDPLGMKSGPTLLARWPQIMPALTLKISMAIASDA